MVVTRSFYHETRGVGENAGKAGWLVESVVLVLCLLWLVPTVGLLITSIRHSDAANSTGWWTWFANPLDITMQNYKGVLTGVLTNPMGLAFVNSLTVSVPSTVIPILIAAFAAYAFTFMEFRGLDVLFIVVVGLLVVPNHVAMVPLSVLFHATTWPRCPGQFLWVWNDLLVSLIFLGPGQNQVMTMALAQMLGDRGQGWQLLTAGAFLTMVLPIIVFVILQRSFVRGLTAGAVKG
ncbi:MAG TPA: carbohydrate ABC transporter permease [Propionibacteriaceae bacterium]